MCSGRDEVHRRTKCLVRIQHPAPEQEVPKLGTAGPLAAVWQISTEPLHKRRYHVLIGKFLLEPDARQPNQALRVASEHGFNAGEPAHFSGR